MILLTAGSNALPGWFRKRTGPDDASTTPQSDSRAATDAENGKSVSTTGGGGSDNEPVVVWEAANRMEAEIVQGRLASEGIPAVIHGESLGTIYGLTTGGLAAARVLVPGLLAGKALDILYGEAEDNQSTAEDAYQSGTVSDNDVSP